MRKPARRREAINQEIIYRPHPYFAGRDIPLWKYGTPDGSATVGGGDIINTGNGVLIIDAFERTTTQSIERLAQRLFDGGAAREVIILQIAKKCAQMRLDTISAVLGEGVLTAYADLGHVRTQLTRSSARGGPDITVRGAEEMESVAASAPGLGEIRTLTVSADSPTVGRGQWNDGSNLLVLKSGVVIVYECSTAPNDYFASQGLEVLTTPSNELGHGRGGAHYMTCPIIRDTVSTPRPWEDMNT